jgi:hypothetical protein
MVILSSFDFGGSKQSYPWAEWLDGQIRMLKAGDDFDCKPSTLTTLARNAAKRQGKVIQSRLVDGGIVIQAVEASPEQLAAWVQADQAKAEAKEADEATEAAEANGVPLVEATEAQPKKSRSKKAAS